MTALGWREEVGRRWEWREPRECRPSLATWCLYPQERAVPRLACSLSLEAFLSIAILELQLVASQNKQSCDMRIKGERNLISVFLLLSVLSSLHFSLLKGLALRPLLHGPCPVALLLPP